MEEFMTWFGRRARPVRAAFTLTEMLVVLVIIGLIAAIVGPRLFNRLDDAKQRTAQLQATALASAVDLFRIDTGRLPTQEEGLDVLVHAPADGAEWLGPYLAKDNLPLDPWGHGYVFQAAADGEHFEVLSYGSDGRAGGERNARDISSADNRSGPAAAVAAAPKQESAPADASETPNL
jgi:general secretion pathway protein G